MSFGPAITNSDIFAVTIAELNEFGCPHCGYRSGSMPMSGGGAGVWECGECHKTSVALAEGVTVSPIGFGFGDGVIYPELQSHPRLSIPAHGRPDKRPDGGGDYFHPRGIGKDGSPGCFVCGGDEGLYTNVAAFVQCKAAGERVVALFAHGARLDYRKSEPDRVQVKVGACEAHVPNLERLYEVTSEAGGVIKQADVTEAVGSNA